MGGIEDEEFGKLLQGIFLQKKSSEAGGNWAVGLGALACVHGGCWGRLGEGDPGHREHSGLRSHWRVGFSG